ncbi:hypothetical protein C2S51_011563 [Perilla frutescens var. frutescens]|nr:hypothetical protein C2S51_011563 [Perilla frutescens var. frutescens]
MFKAPIGFQNPRDVRFDDFSVWIQLHNLPLACMNLDDVGKIGKQVGKVEEVDVGEGGSCVGQFARVRVCRPIAKPLQRCVRVAEISSGESRIVLLLYERLPDFCHACGRVGHVFRHYGEERADKEKLGFGNWLRASKVMDVRRPRGLGVSKIGGRDHSEAEGFSSSSRSESGDSRALLEDSMRSRARVSPKQCPREKPVRKGFSEGGLQ